MEEKKLTISRPEEKSRVEDLRLTLDRTSAAITCRFGTRRINPLPTPQKPNPTLKTFPHLIPEPWDETSAGVALEVSVEGKLFPSSCFARR